MCLQKEMEKLLTSQLEEWETARNNYDNLNGVKIRTFDFENFQVKVQFNPARIVSSGAKTDTKSIAERECFLCSENRPAVQKGIIEKDYTVLINPFPIFKKHFTIPFNRHIPQHITWQNKKGEMPYLTDFIDFAQRMTDYVMFYNGPRCGASAPDHFHFQAGNADFLPLINDYFHLKKNNCTSVVTSGDNFVINKIDNYLRSVYCIESDRKDAVYNGFCTIYDKSKSSNDFRNEPKMNLVCKYQEGKWYLFVIPRNAFRPWQYTAEGDKALLISPATVEMGGLFITPIKEHFEKITKNDIIDIFKQTSSETLIWE